MINLLLGAPGGGKSYEAVVFHVLPALERGRKVITNLPLDLDMLGRLDPTFPALVEFRRATLAERQQVDWDKAESMFKKFGIAARPPRHNAYPFSAVCDYGHTWRHPETGSGPLYVIDECHIALPKMGTPISVEEWFSLHRHESADVLLITQSYGKVNRAIIDLVQVVYRVRKNVAFGSSGTYTRKVQDGVRGDVVNTSIRKYEPRFFNLYKSHTKGGGQELRAQDIVPFWKRWPVVGAAIMLPLAAVILFMAGGINPIGIGSKDVPRVGQKVPSNFVPEGRGLEGRISSAGSAAPIVAASTSASPALAPARDKEESRHPLLGRSLHVVGRYRKGDETVYHFVVSQNGQSIFGINSKQLKEVGYTVMIVEDCLARVQFGAWQTMAICDAPQVAVGGGTSTGAREEAARGSVPHG